MNQYKPYQIKSRQRDYRRLRDDFEVRFSRCATTERAQTGPETRIILEGIFMFLQMILAYIRDFASKSQSPLYQIRKAIARPSLRTEAAHAR